MLVLSRKKSEIIQIGDDVRVRILEISAGRVKIGIEAPSRVSVLRGELIATTPQQEDCHASKTADATCAT